MKSNLFIVLSLFLLLTMCKEEKNNQFKIKGIINGIKDSTKVILFDYENFKVIDSAIINNGQFNFRGNIDFPFEAATLIKDENLLIQFWIEKGDIYINTNKERIKRFQGNYNVDVKGKEINPLILRFNKHMETSQQKKALYYTKMSKGEISENDYDIYINLVYKRVYDFLVDDSNANNYFSLSEIINYKEGISKKQLKSYYNKLSKKLKKSPKGILLKNYIETKVVLVGSMAPDIKATNEYGEDFSISNYKGNYIFLDFWASWCTPCIAKIKNEIPLIKKTYNDENLKIISFSFDVDKKQWIDAIKKLKMDWINISNNNSMGKSPIAFEYGVKELPTGFLINPQGIIIKQINYDENLLIKIKDALADN